MKSLMLFYQQLLNELGSWCRTSTSRDLETISARVKHEGLSFLTISLSNFGSDLQKGLDQGYVDRNMFTGFGWHAGLPRLFGGFLDLVFDRGTGRLLDEPSIDAIFALRQLTLVFAKIEIPCSDTRVEAALDKYVECEQSVKSADLQRSVDSYDDFHRMGSLLFRDMFSSIDKTIYDATFGSGDSKSPFLPKHGPGATADKIRGNAKYSQVEWTERLEGLFPAGEFLFPTWGSYDPDRINWLEPGAERPVRVITVPKTLKTPRIIAIEPALMQYMQQAILEQITEEVDRDDILSTLIGFNDQTSNQRMAKIGSLTGSLATLDLSEASDRVSNQLVRTLLRNHPHFLEAVDATRSRRADVPGRGVFRLAKFASMGSALCFPFEAMVFLTVVFLGMEKVLNRPMTRKDILSYRDRVRIFGDDIIIPVEMVPSVVRELETFGFLVNSGKSFWTGRFRESCGKEFYAGRDVSITKVRHMFPTQRKHAQEIIGAVALRNQLFKAGFVDTVQWLDTLIERLIPFPEVYPTSPVLGRHSHVVDLSVTVWDANLQRPLIRGCVVKTRLPLSIATGEGALLKSFLKRGEMPIADRNHLERAGRPDSVDIMVRRAPIL